MTVAFVIGAGASADYGLPVGARLVEFLTGVPNGTGSDVAEMKRIHHRVMDPGGCGAYIGTLKKTLEETAALLAASGLDSIDRFVAAYPDHAAGAKLMIARVLMPMESHAAEHRFLLTHWHRWFVNALLVHYKNGQQMLADFEHPESLSMKFISFNYDRLFEYALASHITATRNVVFEKAMELVDGLDVLHVYGSFARPCRWDPRNARVELSCGNNEVIAASQQLRLVPEARGAAEDALVQARSVIAEASAVVFLGFGFDELNCQRLGLEDAKTLDCARLGRGVWSTAYGLRKQERSRVVQLLRPTRERCLGGPEEGCEEFLRALIDAEVLGLRPVKNPLGFLLSGDRQQGSYRKDGKDY